MLSLFTGVVSPAVSGQEKRLYPHAEEGVRSPCQRLRKMPLVFRDEGAGEGITSSRARRRKLGLGYCHCLPRWPSPGAKIPLDQETLGSADIVVVRELPDAVVQAFWMGDLNPHLPGIGVGSADLTLISLDLDIALAIHVCR